MTTLSRYLIGGLVALFSVALLIAALTTAALIWLQSDWGRGWLTAKINDAAEGTVEIARIEGRLFDDFTVVGLELSDHQGVWLTAEEVAIDWFPSALFERRLVINALRAPEVMLERLPERPPGQPFRLHMPDLPFPVAVKKIDIAHFRATEELAGRPLDFLATGAFDLSPGALGTVDLQLEPRGEASDRLALKADIAAKTQSADVDLKLEGPSDGLFAALAGIEQAIDVELRGEGPVSDWQGVLDANLGGEDLATLSFARDDAQWIVSGEIAPDVLPMVDLPDRLEARYDIAVTIAPGDPGAELAGTLEGAPGSLAFQGGLYEGEDGLAFADFAVALDPALENGGLSFGEVRVVRPTVELRLDGPVGTPSVGYSARFDAVATENLGLDRLRAEGDVDWQGNTVNVTSRGRFGAIASGDPRIDQIFADGGAFDLATSYDTQTQSAAISRLDFESDALLLQATGRLNTDLSRLSITGQAALGDLASLEPFIGSDISGAGQVEFQVARARADGPYGFNVDVALSDFSAANARLDDLLGGTPRLEARGRFLDAENWELDRAALQSENLALTADGQSTEGIIDGRIAIERSPYGAFTATFRPDGESFDVTLTGQSTLGDVTSEVRVTRGPDGRYVFDPVSLELANLAASGRLVRTPEGLFEGELALALTTEGAPDRGEQYVRGIGGNAQGVLRLLAEDGAQRIEADFRGEEIFLLDKDGELVVSVGPANGTATVVLDETPRIEAEAEVADIVFPGTRRIDSLTLSAQSDGRATDYQMVAEVGGLVSGTLRLSGVLEPREVGQSLTAHIEGDLNAIPVSSPTPLRFVSSADGFLVEPFEIAIGEGRIRGAFSRTGVDREFQLSLTRVPARIAAVATGPLPFAGRLSGDMSLTQNATAREGTFLLRLTDLRPATQATATSEFTINITAEIVDDRIIDATGRIRRQGESLLAAQARIPLTPVDPASWPSFAMSEPLTATASGESPIAPLWALVPADRHEFAGIIAVELAVEGTLGAPDFAGTVTLREGTYQNLDFGIVLADAAADIRFNGREVTLDDLSANDGAGGSLSGSGTVTLDPQAQFPADMRLTLSQMRLVRRDDLRATVSGELSLSTAEEGLILGGNLDIDRARIRLAGGAEEEIPTIEVTEINVPPTLRMAEEEEEARRVTVNLDIGVDAPRRIFIDGMGLQSEWGADLSVTGTMSDPRVSGTLTLVRGDFDLAGSRFQLNRGELRFTGEREIDPLLDVAAESQAGDLLARVRVTGRSSDPEIELTSTPAFPQDEILSRILFGSSVADLGPLEGIQLASALAALSGGGNGLGALNAARSGLGIDRLSFGSGENGRAITGGKYLSDDVYLEVTTDTQTGQANAGIEWNITRRLALLSRFGGSGESDFGVKFSIDY